MQASEKLRQENFRLSDEEYAKLVRQLKAEKQRLLDDDSLTTEVSAKTPCTDHPTRVGTAIEFSPRAPPRRIIGVITPCALLRPRVYSWR